MTLYAQHEILLKTEGGSPQEAGFPTPWLPLGIPFAITLLGQLH